MFLLLLFGFLLVLLSSACLLCPMLMLPLLVIPAAADA
jgi:hypothetical protein